MDFNLLKVALRQQAIYIPDQAEPTNIHKSSAFLTTSKLIKLGYTVSPELLMALQTLPAYFHTEIIDTIETAKGAKNNWTPLIKQWDIPTGETIEDHIFTFFSSVFGLSGTTLQCGHIIPQNTFNLSKYNGCPFCGRPFDTNNTPLLQQGSSLTELNLWTKSDAYTYFLNLLNSKTAPDATQTDSLYLLLNAFQIPDQIQPEIAEIRMLLIDSFISKGFHEKATYLFKNPNDILRYVWYKNTGFLQIVKPKSIFLQTKINNRKSSRRPNIAQTSVIEAIKNKEYLEEQRHIKLEKKINEKFESKKLGEQYRKDWEMISSEINLKKKMDKEKIINCYKEIKKQIDEKKNKNGVKMNEEELREIRNYLETLKENDVKNKAGIVDID